MNDNDLEETLDQTSASRDPKREEPHLIYQGALSDPL